MVLCCERDVNSASDTVHSPEDEASGVNPIESSALATHQHDFRLVQFLLHLHDGVCLPGVLISLHIF